jgi:hypothetical protein
MLHGNWMHEHNEIVSERQPDTKQCTELLEQFHERAK